MPPSTKKAKLEAPTPARSSKAKAPSASSSAATPKRASKKAVDPNMPVTLEHNGFHSIAIAIEPSAVVTANTLPADAEPLRYVYVKRHVPAGTAPATRAPKESMDDEDEEDEQEEDTAPRTISVCGIPPFFTESDLTQVFETFGEVEAAFFQLPEGSPLSASLAGASADVVFATTEALDSVFSTKNAVCRVSLAAADPATAPCGVTRWERQFKALRPDFSQLQTQVDLFMQAFDKRTAAEKDARRSRNIVDEEGFTLVLPDNKKQAARDKASAASALRQYKRKMAAQAENAVTFYKFQDKERQEAQQRALRRKFDEDKQRLLRMKLNRNFKPL